MQNCIYITILDYNDVFITLQLVKVLLATLYTVG